MMTHLQTALTPKEAPEITAYEINKLSDLGRKDVYYLKAYYFVKDFMADRIEYKNMSTKQQRWLWGIKKDLEVILSDEE